MNDTENKSVKLRPENYKMVKAVSKTNRRSFTEQLAIWIERCYHEDIVERAIYTGAMVTQDKKPK